MYGRRSLMKLLISLVITTVMVSVLALPTRSHPPVPPGQEPTLGAPFQPPGANGVPQAGHLPGQILVKFKPTVDTPAAHRVLRAKGLRAMEVSPYGGVMRVQVAPGREDKTIAELLARKDVEIASYNHIIEASVLPDDTYYGNQWALPMIEAPSAWDITTGSIDVVVAIVDSGLDTSHSEFSGRIVDPRDEIDGDSAPQDTCNHGTHVTGIVAAEGNNGSGIAGLAWGVSVMPVRALTQDGARCTGDEFDIHDGVHWAVNHGAKIINLSLGALPELGHTCEQDFPIMSSAIQSAYSAGVLVVAASGNSSTNRLGCPALQSEAMAVGATTSSDQRATYSNYGTGLDLVAPGNGIFSTLPISSGYYGYMSGTSMATPHVAGLAALIWSIVPDLTDDQVRDVIRSKADDLGPPGWDQEFGYGRINAWRALQSVSLETSPELITFLIDDDSGPFPASSDVQITTPSSSAIAWTAGLSPDEGWLSIDPPDSGTVSAASSAGLTLVITRPPLYGAYTTTVVVTGTTVSGGIVGPSTTEARINYLPDLYQYIFPRMFKNSTP